MTRAALGPDGRLYATTPRAVYAAPTHGDLTLVYDAGGDTIHGLVVSGEHVWFADGTELGVVDGDRVRRRRACRVAPDARLAPSASGDVWVLAARRPRSASHAPRRRPALASAGTRRSRPSSRARARVPPAGRRLGDGPLDRGSVAVRARGDPERVVKTRTMPPEGHPLSDADRAAIEAWAEAKP